MSGYRQSLGQDGPPAAYADLDLADCFLIVGANMAAPKRVIAEVGGFHPWLDRAGANLLSSGDVLAADHAATSRMSPSATRTWRLPL